MHHGILQINVYYFNIIIDALIHVEAGKRGLSLFNLSAGSF